MRRQGGHSWHSTPLTPIGAILKREIIFQPRNNTDEKRILSEDSICFAFPSKRCKNDRIVALLRG
jgi:hypothetical protein